MAHRRRVLESIAATAVVGTVGCGARPRGLSFSATVTRERSRDAPARLRARLTNREPDSVAVRFGPALLFTDDASSTYEWTKQLVLDPETDVGPWAKPQYVEGCWQSPAAGRRPIRSSLETRSVSSGEAITESYELYAHESTSCFPSGQFRFQDKITVDGDRRLLTLIVRTEDGLGVSGRIE